MPGACFHVLNAYSLFDKSTHYAFGGAELRASILAKALAKDNSWKVSLITYNHGQKSPQSIEGVTVIADQFYAGQPHAQEGFMDRLAKKMSWYLHKKNYPVFTDYLRHRSLLQTNADVYILFGISGLNKRVVDFCRVNNKKLVLSFASDEELNLDGDNFLSLEPGVVDYFIKNSGLILCQNNFQQARLQELFGRQGVLLLNPMDVPVPYNDKSGDAEKVTAWVGKSNAVKNPLLFLELAKQNPGKKFIMFCSESDKELHAKLRSQLPANIRFVDNGNNEDVEAALAKAHIFVSTSFAEGFSNVFLLAGKYSLPIISCEVDPNNYIRQNNCGFVCSHTASDLNAKLHELYDAMVNARMAGNHYNYVKAHHAIETVLPQFKAALNNA